MNNKKGVSLMVLVITIIVMIILASTILFISAITTNDAKRAAFISDLEQIEDLVKDYYLNNSVLPTTSNSVYTKDNLVSKISDTTISDPLLEEIAESGDANFYELDLTKLPIESIDIGYKEDGDELDVFLIAKDSLNVYYLGGKEIQNEYYFSLTEKLTGKKKINSNNPEDNSTVSITNVTDSINLVKSTSDWTNNMKITVNTTLSPNETLKYYVAGFEISNVTGNIIDVSSILRNNSEISNSFYSSDANKKITVQKIIDGNVTAKNTIDVSKVDTLSGNIASLGIAYSKYDDFTLANLTGYSDVGGSGIKEVRVLYTLRKDDTAYYDNLPTTITADYIKEKGKTANPNVIKLPNDVKSYMLVFVDNAGNVSEISTNTIS